MKTYQSYSDLLADALAPRESLTVAVGETISTVPRDAADAPSSLRSGAGMLAPIIWIDRAGRPDLAPIGARLGSIGAQIATLAPPELARLNGQKVLRWMYAPAQDDFFLQVEAALPALPPPLPGGPELKTNVLIRFDLNRTASLLQEIIASRNLLIRFDEVPDWLVKARAQGGSPLGLDLGEQGPTLIAASLALEFNAEVGARVKAQLDRWQQALPIMECFSRIWSEYWNLAATAGSRNSS